MSNVCKQLFTAPIPGARVISTALTTLALLPLLSIGLAAFAEDSPPHGKVRERMLEKFDTDHDGQLSEGERQAAREAWQRKRFDADNDGVLSDEERATAEAERAKHFGQFDDFDRDRNGELSPEERKAMWRSRREVELDANKDGTVSTAERDARQQTRKAHRAAATSKYDADGDGTLSPSEREAAFRDGHRRSGGEDDAAGADPAESPAP